MSWCFGVINGMASIWGGNYEFHVGVYTCLFEATVILVRCVFFQNKMLVMILTDISVLHVFSVNILACLVRGKNLSRSNNLRLHKLSKIVVGIVASWQH